MFYLTKNTCPCHVKNLLPTIKKARDIYSLLRVTTPDRCNGLIIFVVTLLSFYNFRSRFDQNTQSCNFSLILLHNCIVLCHILMKTWNGEVGLLVLGHILLKPINGKPGCLLAKNKINNSLVWMVDFGNQGCRVSHRLCLYIAPILSLQMQKLWFKFM